MFRISHFQSISYKLQVYKLYYVKCIPCGGWVIKKVFISQYTSRGQNSLQSSRDLFTFISLFNNRQVLSEC